MKNQTVFLGITTVILVVLSSVLLALAFTILPNLVTASYVILGLTMFVILTFMASLREYRESEKKGCDILDERQAKIKYYAAFLGFGVLIVYLTVDSLIRLSIGKDWSSFFTGSAIGIALALCVFEDYCIFNDAAIGIKAKESLVTMAIVYTFIGAAGVLSASLQTAENGFIVEGKVNDSLGLIATYGAVLQSGLAMFVKAIIDKNRRKHDEEL